MWTYIIIVIKLIWQIAVDFKSAVLLIIMPWRLRAVSRSMSPIGMVFAGTFFGWLISGLVFGAFASNMSEPYSLLSEYWDSVAHVVPKSLLLFSVPALLSINVAAAVIVLPRRTRPLLGVLALWPIPLLLPAIVWSFSLIIHRSNVDVFEPNTAVWITWPGWSFLSGCHWPMLLLICILGFIARNIFDILSRDLLKPGICASCGYDLRAIASERCPECGEVITFDYA